MDSEKIESLLDLYEPEFWQKIVSAIANDTKKSKKAYKQIFEFADEKFLEDSLKKYWKDPLPDISIDQLTGELLPEESDEEEETISEEILIYPEGIPENPDEEVYDACEKIQGIIYSKHDVAIKLISAFSMLSRGNEDKDKIRKRLEKLTSKDAELNSIFNYFWNNPLFGYGLETIYYYHPSPKLRVLGKKKDLEDLTNISQNISNGQFSQAEFFIKWLICEKFLKRKGTITYMDKYLPDIEGAIIMSRELINFIKAILPYVTESERKKLQKELSRFQKPSTYLWKIFVAMLKENDDLDKSLKELRANIEADPRSGMSYAGILPFYIKICKDTNNKPMSEKAVREFLKSYGIKKMDNVIMYKVKLIF